MENNTAVPVLTDAQKFAIRDKQLRFVVARANLNNLQQQIQQAHQALQTAQKVFQAELNAVVAEFGTDNTVLDLDAMDFKPKPPEHGHVVKDRDWLDSTRHGSGQRGVWLHHLERG